MTAGHIHLTPTGWQPPRPADPDRRPSNAPRIPTGRRRRLARLAELQRLAATPESTGNLQNNHDAQRHVQ